KNTSDNYGPKQVEFKDWCATQGFPDGDTVSAMKLHFSLETEVVGCQSCKRQKSGAAEKIIGLGTIEAYASALVDLYKQQKHLGMNNNPHPHDKTVNALTKNAQLPNINCCALEGEGFQPCYAMITTMGQGKTNQHNQFAISACLCNKEVQIC
ncbi:hypothetical protein DFS34DRAFT_562038, partial [Phlyctochytrium arcticum]